MRREWELLSFTTTSFDAFFAVLLLDLEDLFCVGLSSSMPKLKQADARSIHPAPTIKLKPTAIDSLLYWEGCAPVRPDLYSNSDC